MNYDCIYSRIFFELIYLAVNTNDDMQKFLLIKFDLLYHWLQFNLIANIIYMLYVFYILHDFSSTDRRKIVIWMSSVDNFKMNELIFRNLLIIILISNFHLLVYYAQELYTEDSMMSCTKHHQNIQTQSIDDCETTALCSLKLFRVFE